MSKKDADRADSYGYRGVVHRDARHTHDGGEEDIPHTKLAKKKGCKKNKGGNHVLAMRKRQYEWMTPEPCCIHCGKVFFLVDKLRNAEWQSVHEAEVYANTRRRRFWDDDGEAGTGSIS